MKCIHNLDYQTRITTCGLLALLAFSKPTLTYPKVQLLAQFLREHSTKSILYSFQDCTSSNHSSCWTTLQTWTCKFSAPWGWPRIGILWQDGFVDFNAAQIIKCDLFVHIGCWWIINSISNVCFTLCHYLYVFKVNVTGNGMTFPLVLFIAPWGELIHTPLCVGYLSITQPHSRTQSTVYWLPVNNPASFTHHKVSVTCQ